jgi:hypothetical protein
MSNKFIRERHLVELLMQRLGIPVSEYLNANVTERHETGVDVIAVTGQGHVGIQVTELDIGNLPGRSRGEEKKAARQAETSHGGVYPIWAQNNPAKVLDAIQCSVSRKSLITPSPDFTEVWLLISCGVPEAGSVGSTFVMTPWLDEVALNNSTSVLVSKSKYERVFSHATLGVERALFEWSAAEGSWRKTIQQEPLEMRGPSFFEVRDNPECFADWLADCEGRADRETKKVLEELRSSRKS